MNLGKWHVLVHVYLFTSITVATKYFHEAGDDDLHHHYDSRFFKGIVTDDERRLSLKALIRAYLLLFDQLELDTWIAHGTLLGWFWTGKTLPWDSDLDMQVSNTTLHILAQNHNHTYHEFHSPHLSLTRRYLLDINSWAWERVHGDGDNVIDARFIDTTNGLFVDITGLSANDPNNTDVIERKNEHKYNATDIFPLRDTTFEGVHASVPYSYMQILANEYGTEALYQTTFHNHTFDVGKGVWQKTTNDQHEEEGKASAGGASA